jgi:hypothetical protein
LLFILRSSFFRKGTIYMRVILASPEAKVWSARKHIPLGLGYLAAVLREGGHDVMIYDAAIEDVGVDYYLDLAEAEGKPYELIGVTATTPLIQEAWEMASSAKRAGSHRPGRPASDHHALESLSRPMTPMSTMSSRAKPNTASWSWSTRWRRANCPA